MSASRDKNQRFTFVYSNFYKIYKSQKGAKAGPVAKAVRNYVDSDRSNVVSLVRDRTGKVAKIDRGYSSPILGPNSFAKSPVLKSSKVKIRPYQPMELIGKKIKRPIMAGPSSLPPSQVMRDPTLKSLKKNIESLNKLHAKLKFMLTELEELSKE